MAIRILKRAPPVPGLKALIRRAQRRDRRSIAKLISITENEPRLRLAIISEIYWRTGRAYVIGVTGPPGCGKSTLIAQLAKRYRESGKSIGVVAVDPSSRLSGGAFLGDRVRMSELASDPKVFIRSMATRGHLGGVARATEDVVRILDACAMDHIIVETAGAGQSDVDIRKLANTTVVVTAPGLGDEIQALKAGLMEIADIFVVNKGDRESAAMTMQELHSMIMMSESTGGWHRPVLRTTATLGEGLTSLISALEQHEQFVRDLESQGPRGEDMRLRADLLKAAREYFEGITLQEIASTKTFERLLARVQARRVDPYTAAHQLLKELWVH